VRALDAQCRGLGEDAFGGGVLIVDIKISRAAAVEGVADTRPSSGGQGRDPVESKT